MNLFATISAINCAIAMPFTFLFFGVALFLTFKMRFPQLQTFKRFLHLITHGVGHSKTAGLKTINPFHALFTAMASTIGIGNIVGPSLAISVGGPGALFWLVVYAFFGSVSKLVEVVFAVHYRQKTADGRILGGPTEYLKYVHPFFASWYGVTTMVLFAGWAGIQSKALAEILEQKHINELVTGAVLAAVVFLVLSGGAKRVGEFASKVVPLMFVAYVSCSLLILFSDFSALYGAFALVAKNIFVPAAPVGGFLGATIFAALHQGTYKGVFVTESGMGTSSIPHSMADVERPIDQGILAMFSVAADTFLCLLSGLLVLTSGIWTSGSFCNTQVFTIFENNFSALGSLLFIMSVVLFVLTTAVGNGFNGGQSFAWLTGYRGLRWYYAFVAATIFISSIADVPLLWAIMDLVLPLVALPNLLGIVYLAIKHPKLLQY